MNHYRFQFSVLITGVLQGDLHEPLLFQFSVLITEVHQEEERERLSFLCFFIDNKGSAGIRDGTPILEKLLLNTNCVIWLTVFVIPHHLFCYFLLMGGGWLTFYLLTRGGVFIY